MHSRNPYQTPPDFEVLAAVYPPLKPHLKYTGRKLTLDQMNKTTIDYNDQEAQRRLAEALLRYTFKLHLTLPPNRLCPPIPNRLNYILWLQDIVAAHRRSYSLVYGASRPLVYGLDIGTGASAIYPLLGCALDPSWRFVATELDPFSFDYASQNVGNNGLGDRIRVWRVNSLEEPLFGAMKETDEVFDFTMCNPPFYSSVQEIEESGRNKSSPPNAICTGSETEMITPGGELKFISRMIQESIHLQSRCSYFTSMVGKLSTVPELVRILKGYGISNWGVTEFVQGQTRRWGVVWSFTDVRLPDSLTRITSPSPSIQASQPPWNSIHYDIINTSTQNDGDDKVELGLSLVKNQKEKLIGMISSLDGVRILRDYDVQPKLEFEDHQHRHRHQYQKHGNGGGNGNGDGDGNGDVTITMILVSAQRNTWSRSARRKKRFGGTAAAASRSGLGLVLESGTRDMMDVGGMDRAEGSFESSSLESSLGGAAAASEAPPEATGEKPELICAVKWVFRSGSGDGNVGGDVGGSGVKLEFEWMYGKERALFESFSGWVWRGVR
ncbi:hypothetical protein BDN72DRAFT_799475 [Pluteus cervinus]|uniref:Uncharacterized protein n=1 Tax=Pluteus cervinus TaxID=181527 RepID=A0ACD3AM24_9AGAR|nr:hypothetical protein BDN72DRAFT_799475 [Pluteus cervinus]